MQALYTKHSEDQIAKVGNTIVYLANHIDKLSKTKLLKLLYLLDEIAIKKSGIPFVNLNYDVWKFGPVDKDIYIELTSKPNFLKAYITRTIEGENTYIKGIQSFEDDEFSDNDMALLDFVIAEFGTKNSRELVNYTHKKGSPWYELAQKNGILEALEKEEINATELEIDMGQLVQYDERKHRIYEDYKRYH